MFALIFRFPADRYHATPWGRDVNEADVAWPPEPWRILRALIATWWRKGDWSRWSEDDLSTLIDALAEYPPVYKLPEGVVLAQTRHYMPAPEPRLVFDAFARLPSNSEVVVAWPEVTLPEALFTLASELARDIGYLGRAESWTDCEAREKWDTGEANCVPEGSDNVALEPVRLIASRRSADYVAERLRLMARFDESQRQIALTQGEKPPSEKKLATERAKAFGSTLPFRLVDALTLDTSDYQRFGWSRPPASRDLLYLRQPLAPISRRSRRKVSQTVFPTVVRFVLAGRPRPRIEDTIKIGELMRIAALAQFGWTKEEATGRSRPNAPPIISGRDADNRPLRKVEHRHAFWLPEDADEDGEIDHVVIYAQDGFCPEVRRKLDRLTKLWIEPNKRNGRDEGAKYPDARQEWRLALEGFGMPKDFRDASQILRKSAVWESVTPFLASGHLKSRGYPAEFRRLAAHRQLPELIDIVPLRPFSPPELESDLEGHHIGIRVRGRLRRAVHFHRFRSRGRESQPDTIGTFLQIRFQTEIDGPLALGYASHFGLGLFKVSR